MTRSSVTHFRQPFRSILSPHYYTAVYPPSLAFACLPFAHRHCMHTSARRVCRVDCCVLPSFLFFYFSSVLPLLSLSVQRRSNRSDQPLVRLSACRRHYVTTAPPSPLDPPPPPPQSSVALPPCSPPPPPPPGPFPYNPIPLFEPVTETLTGHRPLGNRLCNPLQRLQVSLQFSYDQAVEQSTVIAEPASLAIQSSPGLVTLCQCRPAWLIPSLLERQWSAPTLRCKKKRSALHFSTASGDVGSYRNKVRRLPSFGRRSDARVD